MKFNVCLQLNLSQRTGFSIAILFVISFYPFENARMWADISDLWAEFIFIKIIKYIKYQIRYKYIIEFWF